MKKFILKAEVKANNQVCMFQSFHKDLTSALKEVETIKSDPTLNLLGWVFLAINNKGEVIL